MVKSVGSTNTWSVFNRSYVEFNFVGWLSEELNFTWSLDISSNPLTWFCIYFHEFIDYLNFQWAWSIWLIKYLGKLGAQEWAQS